MKPKSLSIAMITCGLLGAFIPAYANAQTIPANLPARVAGSDDLLAIFVYGSPELSRTVRVGADGAIRLPMLPTPVPAAGSMPREIEQALAAALSKTGLIVNPYVSVTVVEYRSRPISVSGAVKRPTTFQAIADMTLLDAIAQADGLTPDAGDEILVSKVEGDQTILRRIAVKSLIDAADPGANMKLSGGEQVRVPEAGHFFVLGNVRRPGSFVIRDGSSISIFKALALAEGLAPFAGKQVFLLHRNAGGATVETSIDLKKVLARQTADVEIGVNDILYIPDNSGRRLGVAVLEKALMFGSGASSALIYGSTR
jgi:polysaccharide export outer membrane protein